MRSFTTLSFLTLFCANCTFYPVPSKLEDNCARETKNIETEKYLIFLLTKNTKMEPHYLGSGFVAVKNGKTVVITAAHTALKNVKTGELHPNGLFAEFYENSKQIVSKVYIAAVNISGDVALLRTDHPFRAAAKLAKDEGDLGSCIVIAGYSFASKKPARTSGNFYGYFPLSVPDWGVKTLAQTITAHILDGLSGGPVFNKNGEVISVALRSVIIEKPDGTQSRFSVSASISEVLKLK